MKLDLVRVKWIDSCSQRGAGTWVDLDDVMEMEPVEVESVGFLLRDEKDFIVIASHIAGSQVGGDLCVPRSCIVKMKSVK